MEFFNIIAGHHIWRQYGIVIAWAVAGLCLFVSISYIGWNTYSIAQQKKTGYAVQEAQPLSKNTQKSYRVQDIVNANLFGDPTPKPVVKQAPKTTLDLKLEGILWASDPLLARAIISKSGENTQVYAHGEEVRGASASIEEIRATEVLLNRNGALETLPFVKNTKSGNRSIISYSQASAQPKSGREDVVPVRTSLANAENKRPFKPSAPRKPRRSKLSGLDRALKKIGDL